ncbi:MAG: hypothetical protein CW691_10380 [Candidatus Bathyarchaeum sp.]|nr:MAG: hypothetical protein CW691_10380 [Candidatus Bathyarchaeum sp.]
MNRNFVMMAIVVNVLVVVFGGVLSYSDVNSKTYTGSAHQNTQIIDVEYSPLMYRATYQYYDMKDQQTVVTVGSWSLDFLQVSILVIAVADLLLLLFEKQKGQKIDVQNETAQFNTPSTF